MPRSLKVLFLAAEADPFVKIGGLGDIAASLPAALRGFPAQDIRAETGGAFEAVDIRVVLPLHGAIQRQSYKLQRAASFELPYRTGPVQAEVLQVEEAEGPVYLVSGPFIPADAPVYSNDAALDGEKYAFFSLAALELAHNLNWSPHIVHANDWHTAPAVYALYLDREPDSRYYNTATLLGLHNLPYLGEGAGPALEAFGLPPAEDGRLPTWARSLPLPLGLLGADHIVAVSPTYGREILTPEFGAGLQNFLATRVDAISGILNGIDTEAWDPRRDPALEQTFSTDRLEDRMVNKLALQREFGLATDPRAFLIGLVSRLENQKGVDLIPPGIQKLARQTDLAWQPIVLGTGDPLLEAALRSLQTEFPHRVRTAIRYDSTLSRRIYGSADALLLPSRYEPCGLAQMIAMRYGCVPIARATGGLMDTIQAFGEQADSTGFLFKKATGSALEASIRQALEVYQQADSWQNIQQRGMEQDFSWNRFARQYLKLYARLVKHRQAEKV